MIFHTSISAEDPEHVAHVVAELWGGEAFPFAPSRRGSWIVAAGDDRGTILEIYPHGHLLHADREKHANDPLRTDLPRATATHVAIGTILTPEQVEAIGEREGWVVRRMSRGGGFDVIELWAENAVMFEVVTNEMVPDYLQSNTLEKWRALVTRMKPQAPSA
jgi:hypothetical protein